jgi:hypothetical protein
LRVVLDASVVVKWALPEPDREANVPQALHLLAGIKDGHLEPIQPPHWLAEVAAVVTRLRPEIAEETARWNRNRSGSGSALPDSLLPS